MCTRHACIKALINVGSLATFRLQKRTGESDITASNVEVTAAAVTAAGTETASIK